MSEMPKEITVLQAYRAMFAFLEREYELTKSDDIGSLLGSLQLTVDGRTMDPAAWNDWLVAVDKALKSD